jgi:DNA-binding transcriptional ArsR family regulator
MELTMNAALRDLAENQAAVCSVFANAKRIMILWSIAEREKSVTEIAQEIDASMQSTSQHLNLMKRQDIVKSRRVGQTIFYRIGDNELLCYCGLFNPEASWRSIESIAGLIDKLL